MVRADGTFPRYTLVTLVLIIMAPLLVFNIAQVYLRLKAVEHRELAARQEYADALGTTFANYVDELWMVQYMYGKNLIAAHPDEINDLLEADLTMHPAVTSFIWVNVDQVIVGSGAVPRPNLALTFTDLLRRHEQQDKILSDLVYEEPDHQPFLLVSRAIRKGGALQGVLVAVVHPDGLAVVLPRQEGDRVNSLFDRQGRKVFDTHSTNLTWDERLASPSSLVGQSLKDQAARMGTYISTHHGTAMLAASVPIEPFGWIAFSASMKVDALRAARYDALGTLAMVLFVTIISLLVAWGYLSKALRLERTILALADGDRTVRAATDGTDELKVTGQAINKIASQMELEQHRLRTVLDVLPVGIVVADTDGQFLMVNEAGRKIWGTSQSLDEMIQTRTYKDRAWWVDTGQLVRVEDWGLSTVLRTGAGVINQEFHIAAFDGHRRTILNSAEPILDETGVVLGGVSVIVDITERKQTEEELRESRSLLEEQREILEMISAGAPLARVLQAIVDFIERHSAEALALIIMLDPTGMSLRPVASGRLSLEFVAGLRVIPVQSDRPLTDSDVDYGAEDLSKASGTVHGGWPMRSHALAHGLRSCLTRPVRMQDGRRIGTLSVYYRQVGRPPQRDIRLVDVCIRLISLAAQRAHSDDERAQKLHSLITQMNEGVVAVDDSGQIVTLNPAARRLLRLEPTDKPKRGLSELLDTLLAQLETAAVSATVNSGRQIMRDLDQRQFSAYVTPVVTEVGRSGAIAILRDVTLEIQLRQLQKSFVANVSHELRGPLTSLSVTIEALCDGVIPEADRPRYLRGVRSEMDRLRRLSYDIVDISRLESGLLRLEQVDFNLAEVLDELPVKWSQRCASEGISLQVGAVDLMVRADHDRVQQALANLIDNAVRFTPSGGTVEVSATARGEMVRVSVRDSGVGIPAEHLVLIWERFYKLDKARTASQESGTGLGLSIVKKVIEAMGGRVGVESKPGVGSTFWFTLPGTVGEQINKGGT